MRAYDYSYLQLLHSFLLLWPLSFHMSAVGWLGRIDFPSGGFGWRTARFHEIVQHNIFAQRLGMCASLCVERIRIHRPVNWYARAMFRK